MTEPKKSPADQFREEFIRELFKKIMRNKPIMLLLCRRLNLFESSKEKAKFVKMETTQAGTWFLKRVADREIDVGQVIDIMTQPIIVRVDL